MQRAESREQREKNNRYGMNRINIAEGLEQRAEKKNNRSGMNRINIAEGLEQRAE